MSAAILRRLVPALVRAPEDVLNSYRLVPWEPGGPNPQYPFEQAFNVEQIQGAGGLLLPRGSRIRVPRQQLERLGGEASAGGGAVPFLGVGASATGSAKPAAGGGSARDIESLARTRVQRQIWGGRPGMGKGSPSRGLPDLELTRWAPQQVARSSTIVGKGPQGGVLPVRPPWEPATPEELRQRARTYKPPWKPPAMRG